MVKKFAKVYLEEGDVIASSSLAPSNEVMNFVRSDKLDFEIQMEGDSTAKKINTLLKSFDEVYSSQVDIQVVFKLKVYYIGGVLDRLSSDLTKKHKESSKNLTEKALKQIVNQDLQKMLGKNVWKNLVVVVSMDMALGEEKKDFFRQWKHRILKFYQICKLQKLLLFTNLSFSFISKRFPGLEKSKLLLAEICSNKSAYPSFHLKD